MYLRPSLGAVVCLLAVVSAWCGEAQFTLTPAIPIKNAPVKAIASDTTLTSLFLSTDLFCASTIAGSTVAVSATTHAATFYLPTSDVINTYICSGTGVNKLFDITFTAITFSPQFLITNTAQTFTFKNAIAGSTVSLRQSSACGGTTAFSSTLPTSLQAAATVTAANTYHMCIGFTSSADGSSVLINLGNTLSADVAKFLPATTIRYDSVPFEVTDSARANANILITTDAFCELSVQGPIATSSLRIATFAVTVPKGLYYLCVDLSDIFYPAGILTVQEYIITPRTLFSGISVPMTLSADIGTVATVAFSSDSACTTMVTTDIAVTGGTFNRVFTTVGIFYSCIKKTASSVYVRASEHEVIAPYSAIIDRGTDVVRGLSFQVTVSPIASLLVSLVMGTSCFNTPFFTGTTSSFKVGGTVPLTGTSVGVMTVCLQTSDASYNYSVATATVRNMTIAFDGALIEDIPKQLTIDNALQTFPGSTITPAFQIAQGSMVCDSTASIVLGPIPATSTYTFTFNNTGTYTLCARSYDASFVAITTLFVYTLATGTPNSTFANLAFTATLVNVPLNVVAGIGNSNCSILDVQTIQTSATANVVFSSQVFTVAAVKALCIYYPTIYGRIQQYVVTPLTISLVSHSPNRAFISQTTRFALLTVDSYILAGARSFVTTGGSSGCGTVPTITYAVLFTSLSKPYVLVPMPSTFSTVNLCVGGNTLSSGLYVSTGTITTLQSVSVVLDPATPLTSIPFSMEFFSPSGGTTSSKYRISKTEDGCSIAVKEGPLVALKTTSTITLTEENDYNICIEVDTNSYLSVKSLYVGLLTASPSSYVSGTSTELRSSPSVPGLFLTVHIDCVGTRYEASVASPLGASAGEYQMCATVGGVLVASSNRVTVISQYVVSIPDRNTIRSYLSFSISITGGDVSGRSVPVYFVPSTSPTTGYSNECINTSYTLTSVVSRFNASSSNPMMVSIDGPELVPYRMCLVTADGISSVELMSITPNPYVIPSSLVKGLPVTITSGGSMAGYASLSGQADCSAPLLLGPVQLTNYLWDSVTIPVAETSTEAYYCEALSSLGVYSYRGTMSLITLIATTLPPPSTNPPTDPVGFEDRYFLPAVPITLAVPAASGSNPFVSHFHNCTDVINVVNGIVPREDEVASYYVCAATPDGTLNYSRATPNLHVSKYVISPNVGQSTVSTALLMTPSTKTTSVYFSSNSNCLGGATVASPNYLGTASGLNAGLQSLASTHVGIIYVCNQDVSSTLYIPVASYLSVGLPIISAPVTTPVKGLPWCMTRTVPGSLFSLVQGGDTASVYASYYSSTDRRSFLVLGGTTCDVAQAIGGVTYTQTAAAGELCVQTTGLTAQAYRLCTGTPFGFAVQAEETIAEVTPTPSAFYTGTVTETTFPGMPNRSLLFVMEGQACSLANAVTVSFTTDASGVAQVSTVSIITGQVQLTPANYTLCAKLDQNDPSSGWGAVLDAVPIVAQQQFALGFTSFTAGVATPVPLLFDLTGDVVRGTLSPVTTGSTSPINNRRVTTTACSSTLATSVGSIATTASATTVSMTVSVPGQYVVCALTTLNDTMVAVATITVYSPILQFVSSVEACDIAAVTYLRSDDASTTQATDIYLNADSCCGVGNVRLTDASKLLQVVEKPAVSNTNQALRTVEVEDSRLAVFAPQTTFRMCLANSTLCLDTGFIDFSGSICETTTLSPGGPSSHIGGAAPRASNFLDDVPLTLLIIVFCLLLLLIVVVCVVCICCCRNRVTPKDEAEDEDDEDEAGEWKKSYNAMLAHNRAGVVEENHGIVDVPIDMRLDICSEPPLSTQDEEVEEDRQRTIIEHQEEELRQEMYARQAMENADIDDWDTAQDRERVSRSLMKAVRVPYSDEVVAEEEDRRLELEEVEDNARLNIAEMERELWRHRMDTERNLLQQQLESDPYWRSRRRQLREANDRALTSINTVAVQHSNHPFSPTRSDSPVRGHPTERMYQGTNRSASLLSPTRSRGASTVSIPIPNSPHDSISHRGIPSNVGEETFIDDNGDVTASTTRTASGSAVTFGQTRQSASNRADPHAVW